MGEPRDVAGPPVRLIINQVTASTGQKAGKEARVAEKVILGQSNTLSFLAEIHCLSSLFISHFKTLLERKLVRNPIKQKRWDVIYHFSRVFTELSANKWEIDTI